MFGGKALRWMAGTSIWMPGTRRARAGQTYPHRGTYGLLGHCQATFLSALLCRPHLVPMCSSSAFLRGFTLHTEIYSGGLRPPVFALLLVLGGCYASQCHRALHLLAPKVFLVFAVGGRCSGFVCLCACEAAHGTRPVRILPQCVPPQCSQLLSIYYSRP